MKQLIKTIGLFVLCTGIAQAIHHREHVVTFGDNVSFRSKASTKRFALVTSIRPTEFEIVMRLQEAGGSCTNRAKGWFSLTSSSQVDDLITTDTFINKKWFDTDGVKETNPCRLNFELVGSHDLKQRAKLLWFEIYINPRFTQKFILKDTSTITLRW
jgi:hypothetical protein